MRPVIQPPRLAECEEPDCEIEFQINWPGDLAPGSMRRFVCPECKVGLIFTPGEYLDLPSPPTG